MSKLVQRKLSALKYPQPEKFIISDKNHFKRIILWIEDQKIRHYKIEDRKNLRNFQEPDWTENFQKYLNDLHCPFTISEGELVVLDWILGLAIRLEYGDNVEKYSQITGKSVMESRNNKGRGASQTSIYNITTDNPEFKKRVSSIAQLLGIQLHEDYMITLKSIQLLVGERLTPEAIANAKEKPPEKTSKIPMKDNALGFDTGDETINQAARALRLLHINELREFQTKINEAIVAVQSITANPKTNQSLGRVGR